MTLGFCGGAYSLINCRSHHHFLSICSTGAKFFANIPVMIIYKNCSEQVSRGMRISIFNYCLIFRDLNDHSHCASINGIALVYSRTTYLQIRQYNIRRPVRTIEHVLVRSSKHQLKPNNSLTPNLYWRRYSKSHRLISGLVFGNGKISDAISIGFIDNLYSMNIECGIIISIFTQNYPLERNTCVARPPSKNSILT